MVYLLAKCFGDITVAVTADVSERSNIDAFIYANHMYSDEGKQINKTLIIILRDYITVSSSY